MVCKCMSPVFIFANTTRQLARLSVAGVNNPLYIDYLRHLKHLQQIYCYLKSNVYIQRLHYYYVYSSFKLEHEGQCKLCNIN